MEKISIQVQMKTEYLFDFLYWHSYSGLQGMINYGFTVFAIVLLATGAGRRSTVATAALILLALLFSVINPLLLYRKAAIQRKRTPMFQKPLVYELTEEGLSVTQDGETASTGWEQVLLIRETKKNIILYLGAANAIVLPKAEYAGQAAEVKAMLRRMTPNASGRWKK